MPVDFYVGGTEHSILHLLYARFIMKALHRLGHVRDNEPFQTFFGNGMVYLNGSKMSKSKGNVVNPDDMVKQYGTDALRGYILFMGPADQDVEWQPNGITGVRRFLDKAWSLLHSADLANQSSELHESIIKLGSDLNQLLPAYNFNRCISAFMIALNGLANYRLSRHEAEVVVRYMAPFFPHFAEEIWEFLGNTSSVFAESWPSQTKSSASQVTYAIQINGKTKATIVVASTTDQKEVEAQAAVQLAEQLEQKTILRTVFVPGRIVNFVVQ